MEPLLEQLKGLPEKWKTLGRGTKVSAVLAVLVLAAIGGVGWIASGGADSYQYAFTNLSPEDGAAAATALKASGVPFRIEAGGTALAVPSAKVYDVRMMLAAQGLPKAGGVGFELFDKGQFGVSEFTQRVNLRRAIEGELGRTVGNLSEVRSARVHLSLGERGLYRDEDKKATASVVVQLQPGRTLTDGQLSGIRHLVASAVPGLSPESVTVMDGHGAVLGEAAGAVMSGQAFETQMESQLQQRIVSLLEPVVGAGSVLARITVNADSSEVSQNSEVFDPDQVAVRTEKKVSQNQQTDNGANGGVAGAAANQPMNPQGASGGGSGNKTQSGSQDEVRSFEISKTQSTTVIKTPRLRRISVAVLLDQPKAGAREEAGSDAPGRAGEEGHRLRRSARRSVSDFAGRVRPRRGRCRRAGRRVRAAEASLVGALRRRWSRVSGAGFRAGVVPPLRGGQQRATAEASCSSPACASLSSRLRRVARSTPSR